MTVQWVLLDGLVLSLPPKEGTGREPGRRGPGRRWAGVGDQVGREREWGWGGRKAGKGGDVGLFAAQFPAFRGSAS